MTGDLWAVAWKHEDGEFGAWICYSRESVVRSITEMESIPEENTEPGDDATLDVEWTEQDGVIRAGSDNSGTEYRAEATGVPE